ncbi:MAG: sucrase ferredoxin [Dermatophilaceae bacterium]
MRVATDEYGHSKTDACSVIWDEAGASALGTAPAAAFWVALEQSGPWGPRAATQSGLEPELGLALERRCQEAGGRLVLIRRPGAHPDAREGGPQHVYLAGGLADRPWLLQESVDDPFTLLQLPWDALIRGDLAAVRSMAPELEVSPAPVLLVCTNSRRDVCCALRGRPVALECSAQRPEQVWECSHTGGHRFAPTGVLLPYGQTFARLSVSSAVAAVDAATRGEVPGQLLGASYDRGRSHLEPAAQAAESVVRQQLHEPSLMSLSTTALPHPGREDAWQCRVRHIDGRHWDVVAMREPDGGDRPESCGKTPVPTWRWSVS